MADRRVSLAERVNLLFATIIDTGGAEVSTSAVADRLSEVLGRPILTADIDALRRTQEQRPREDVLLALARYFDMPGSFLSEDPDEYRTMYLHLKLLIAQRDRGVPYLALRPAGDQLSDDAVAELTKHIESID